MTKKIKIILISVISLLVITGSFFIGFITYFYNYDNDTTEDYSSCNVGSVNIKGELVSYVSVEDKDLDGNKIKDVTAVDDIVNALNKISTKDNIKYILLDIDSYGGSPFVSAEVYDYIKKKLPNKKVVTYVREAALSSAYYIASVSDYIIAGKASNIGSIGATNSFLNYYEKNKRDGIEFVELTTGKYKNTATQDKEFTIEDRNILMRDLNILKDNFVKDVASGRGLSIEEVERLADGSSMLGEMALENKLIDQVGGWYDTQEYIKKQLGEDLNICVF